MLKSKNLLFSVIVTLLILSAFAFSGCILGEDDSSPAIGTQSNAFTRPQEPPVSFSPGAWLAQNAAESLLGSVASQGANALVPMIFGNALDPTGKKLDDIISEMRVINQKLDQIVVQLGQIQAKIDQLAGALNVLTTELKKTIMANAAQGPIAVIDNQWTVFSKSLIISDLNNHTRQQVIAKCSTTESFLIFAGQVEMLNLRSQVQSINNILLTDGLSASSGGLLKIWTDMAIVAYMSRKDRNSSDFINSYNFIESNFQNALLLEAKGATMIICALQALERNSQYIPTSSDYRNTFKGFLNSQANAFRKQVERFVLTCADIKTAKDAIFLPEGYKTVFARADYLYLMLAAGPDPDNNPNALKDASGLPAYGLCGRVISPVALSGGGTVVRAGSLGEALPAETATCKAETVDVNKAIVPRKIDSWRTEFLPDGEPMSRLSVSDEWYIYRYYYKGPLGKTGIVSMELRNDVNKYAPVCYDSPAVANYDEAKFTVWTAGTSESRIVKYGDFTITAGFAGNSVFFFQASAPERPYIWLPYVSKNTGQENSVVRTLYAESDNRSQRMKSSGYSVDTGSRVHTKCYLTSSLKKIIKYDGPAPTVTVKLHVNLQAKGHNRFNHGTNSRYDNYVAINISESDSTAGLKTSPKSIYEDGLHVQRRSTSSQISRDWGDEGPLETYSQAISRDIPVTFETGKYYRVSLYANIWGEASGYYYRWARRNFYLSTIFSLESEGELKEMYLNFPQ